MIYLDTSVVLAALFDEERRPSADFWQSPMVSSRLLEYELLVRCHARRVDPAIPAAILARVGLVELAPMVLRRALSPFPTPVRTLDALHLATTLYLRDHGQPIALATYDARLAAAAEALAVPLHFA